MASQIDGRVRTIAEQRDEVEALLSNMIQGVLVVDAEERVLRLNAAAAELLDLEPQLLEQAAVNLIDNATKYSEPGSTVRVTGARAKSEVTISISDRGCGISEEHLPRLFERFYRVDKGRSRKLGGTGLGLAIVKHIAQAHGGNATVESKPGRGSTFSIHLPAN